MRDMGAVFFDADIDGDLDLFVVSGGNEYVKDNGFYQDRLYINDGQGNFSHTESALPVMRASGSRVIIADYDKDGDTDLFVCGRQVPGRYPEPAESYLLKNLWKETGKLRFEKVSNNDLVSLGMVTDARWSDYDGGRRPGHNYCRRVDASNNTGKPERQFCKEKTFQNPGAYHRLVV